MKIAHLNSSCIDKSNGRKVRKKMCGPRHTRPKGRRRSCNTFSCDFEWASDRWEPCTRSCGSQGLRQRQVYCVPLQNNQTQDVQLWRQMVDPRKCPGDRPKRISECNRVPCPAKWIAIGTFTKLPIIEFSPFLHPFFALGWSDCSSTCGSNGIQKMRFECEPPDGEVFYDCGIEPISVRKCQNNPTCPSVEVCDGDDSPICQDATMMRYCIIPDYRKKCCGSCSRYNGE